MLNAPRDHYGWSSEERKEIRVDKNPELVT